MVTYTGKNLILCHVNEVQKQCRVAPGLPGVRNQGSSILLPCHTLCASCTSQFMLATCAPVLSSAFQPAGFITDVGPNTSAYIALANCWKATQKHLCFRWMCTQPQVRSSNLKEIMGNGNRNMTGKTYSFVHDFLSQSNFSFQFQLFFFQFQLVLMTLCYTVEFFQHFSVSSANDIHKNGSVRDRFLNGQQRGVPSAHSQLQKPYIRTKRIPKMTVAWEMEQQRGKACHSQVLPSCKHLLLIAPPDSLQFKNSGLCWT